MRFLTNVAVNLADIKERLMDATFADQRKDLKDELDELCLNINKYQKSKEVLTSKHSHNEKNKKEAREIISDLSNRKNLRKKRE